MCDSVCGCVCGFVCFSVCVSMRVFVSETRCPRACLSGCRSVGRCVCVGLSECVDACYDSWCVSYFLLRQKSWVEQWRCNSPGYLEAPSLIIYGSIMNLCGGDDESRCYFYLIMRHYFSSARYLGPRPSASALGPRPSTSALGQVDLGPRPSTSALGQVDLGPRPKKPRPSA